MWLLLRMRHSSLRPQPKTDYLTDAAVLIHYTYTIPLEFHESIILDLKTLYQIK